MNTRQHAHLARALQDANDGADACVNLLEETPHAVGRTVMYACRKRDGGKTLPVGAIFLLEQACGRKIYSQALMQAGLAPTEAECAISEACEGSEAMAMAQALIRKAGEDSVYTENEKAEIEPHLQRAEASIAGARAAMDAAS
ncbi:hypothetical protein D3C73_422580 [compost metagenome]